MYAWQKKFMWIHKNVEHNNANASEENAKEFESICKYAKFV